MSLLGLFLCWFHTTLNVLLYALTLGRYTWLEGRFSGGRFHDWARFVRFRPQRIARPRSEAEIVAAIASAGKVRAVGSGHSFNTAIVSEEVLVTLDGYRGVIDVDRERRRVRVRAGTRIRDLNAALRQLGLALPVLPSHDAQSLGAVLATDVHGTGRTASAFLSEAVTGLKLVDGRGEVVICTPADDVFRAAIGGIGALGIVCEVELQCVDRFRIEQRSANGDLVEVLAGLEERLGRHDHLSLYVFPFTDRCLVNTWDRSEAALTPAVGLREFLAISFDALTAASVCSLVAACGWLPRLSAAMVKVKRPSRYVLESFAGFNRSIYHLHRELEFTVPYPRLAEALAAFRALYEKLYRLAPLPYTLLEVRFTPAGHECTLVGPGGAGRHAWIDLICNQTGGHERYYQAAGELMRELGGRPHLGKHAGGFGGADPARLYGERHARFRQQVRRHDPQDKFGNAFTRRVLGLDREGSEAAAATDAGPG